MKKFILENKITIVLISIILILLVSLFAKSFGMEDYQTLDFSLGIVNTDYLNMRSGAGINFKSVDLLKRNEYVRIFGKIGEWYIIQNEENKIGAAHERYITPTSEQKAAATNTETVEETKNQNLTDDESQLLSLINAERNKNNLSSLEIDENLQNVARLKAQELFFSQLTYS